MTIKVHHQQVEEESYFISMTDLMVGLLFIFIIMLMFFVLQFKDASARAQKLDKEYQEEIIKIRNIESVRTQLLEDIQESLKKEGIQVEIVLEQGIVRLPESILFEKGDAKLNTKGIQAIQALMGALEIILPCYTKGNIVSKHSCPKTTAYIEAIFIEGHTDNDPLNPYGGMRDNLDLSAIRATNTYRELLKHSSLVNGNPIILEFKNTRGVPVLSVSGYGEYRPIEQNQHTEEVKSLNRRIDLRILMETPTSKSVRKFENNLTTNP